jgi:hypothetical protein
MPAGKDTIAGYIAQAAEKLRTDFEYIRGTNPHAGESGGEAEQIVKEFLNRHMPQRFRAASGFVIDNDSQMSEHEDVLVYDALSSPIFRYTEDNQIISADAVASVIEVKSVLNKKELENAFEKIAEVKRLRKSPLSEMDQKATESQLTTTGTFGVVFGFSTETKLVTLAQHCAEFNERYDTYQRPDLIFVLNVGVINYTAKLIGARKAGDFSAPADENFPIPPCYVQLTAREDGLYALNRFFTHLLSHLAFYPRRPSIPPLSVLLEGSASTTFAAAMYQYNTEARLVPFEAAPPVPSESLRVIKIHARTTDGSKEYKEAATLTFFQWQDGGVIRMKGMVPLSLILKMVTDARPITIVVEDAEYSMVLKVTRPEFEKWPALIEAKSDMKASLAVPPPFESRHFSSEGTGEPSIARIFLGIIDMAQGLMSPTDKSAFDDVFAPCLFPGMEMRKSLVAIRDLVNNHRRALEKGSIVRKQAKDFVVKERIDGPLRKYVAHFLEMASEVIDHLPAALKFLGIDIHYYAGNEQRFHRGWERTQKDRPELAEYLFRLRPTLLSVKEKFRELRYAGWHLPNIVYVEDGNKMVMKELKIDGKLIVEYFESIYSTITLATEELIMYGLKGQGKGLMIIDEIPIASRNPANAQRFKKNMRGMGEEWELKWTGKGFYES